MTSPARPGTWEERYLDLVPERLTAADARDLLALIREDPELFMASLAGLADDGEEDET